MFTRFLGRGATVSTTDTPRSGERHVCGGQQWCRCDGTMSCTQRHSPMARGPACGFHASHVIARRVVPSLSERRAAGECRRSPPVAHRTRGISRSAGIRTENGAPAGGDVAASVKTSGSIAMPLDVCDAVVECLAQALVASITLDGVSDMRLMSGSSRRDEEDPANNNTVTRRSAAAHHGKLKPIPKGTGER